MKKIFYCTFLFFSLNSFANDCPLDFSKVSALCAELTWIDGPHDGVPSHFEVSFYKLADVSKSAVHPIHKLRFYTYMIMENGHHHEGPKVNAVEISPGIFEIRDARFFLQGMKGHWEVRIDFSLNNQILSTQSYKVKLL